MVEPPVSGFPALACAFLAVAVPTLIRYSVEGVVTGCQGIPYVPFILGSAILLGWRYAAVVALVSSIVTDFLFIGLPNELIGGPCDIFGVSSVLIASIAIIGFVEAFRSILRDVIGRRRGRIVFSLKDGQAWASWYGHRISVQLGNESEVADMMRDFLAQGEVAKRLLNEARDLGASEGRSRQSLSA